MERSAILLPFFGVMLLTLVVWLVMYIRRIRYLLKHKVDLRTVDTPDKAASVVPYETALATHNLKNLFELPVLFYAVCLYLYVSESFDTIDLAAAWWFFAFRVVHSIVHCSSNVVIHRFAAYQLSAVALWLMVIRAAMRAVGIF